jgi:nucleoid-associated protein YgaU
LDNITVKPEPLRFKYTVKKGDQLTLIAFRMYGKSYQWKIIYDANKDVIKNPHKLSVGQILTIPNE